MILRKCLKILMRGRSNLITNMSVCCPVRSQNIPEQLLPCGARSPSLRKANVQNFKKKQTERTERTDCRTDRPYTTNHTNRESPDNSRNNNHILRILQPEYSSKTKSSRARRPARNENDGGSRKTSYPSILASERTTLRLGVTSLYAVA